MVHDIMLTLIPPVDDYPVQAVICVLVIILMGRRRGGRPYGCNG
ncbi:hypothetical protein AB0O64_05790 [Streptomyces sp. NPDC088341]